MTTTVTVKARAHGALVTIRTKGNAVNGSDFTLPANTSRDFHIDGEHIIEVKQGEAPAPAAENPIPLESQTGEEVLAENGAIPTDEDPQ